MQKEPKKLSRGLIIVLALTYIFLLVFFISLLVFGGSATKCADPDFLNETNPLLCNFSLLVTSIVISYFLLWVASILNISVNCLK